MQPSPEETQLVEQSLRGDQRAQYQLYEKYVQAMYNTVLRIVVHPMDAQDVLQETFVKVFQNLSYFKGESTLGAWIKRIAVNTSLNFLRKNRKVRIVELDPKADLAPNQEERTEPVWDMASIHHAVKELPEGSRLVLSLYLLEGYQHKEVAQILGITESTSKSQYQRGRKMLQKILIKKYPQRLGYTRQG